MTLKTEPFIINIGPQHPSTHGVFRLRVLLDGEVVVDAEPVIGYLHSSMEKVAEERTWTQAIVLSDRMDYLAGMTGNLAYSQAVEKLAGIEVPERAQYLRVIMAELQRFASHCFAVGTFINDCGAWHTPLLYMLRDRERVMDLFEMVCGERITVSYMRIGGVAQDVPEEFWPALKKLVDEIPDHIDEYEQLLSENEIILARTKGVGILPRELAINCGASGPVLRASGVPWDLRKADPYAVYDRLNFDIPTGQTGDCYDRYWVRLQEMRQSINIIKQAMEQIPGNSIEKRQATEQIHEGAFRAHNIPFLSFRPPVGEAYGRVESPRGELGYFVVSDGSVAPYRFKVRSPSFINLTALRDMIIGWKVADVVVILGSIDIVMGEVDR